MAEQYSVLMSVYKKELPEFLKESMESIFNQTIPTDDFVLVCDGPLNDSLDSVISEMQLRFGSRLRVFRLEKNSGLGIALNNGIKHCKHDLVARMDSDDISRPSRCEMQLKKFQEDPTLSIVSGTVEEFVGDTNNITGRRVLPEKQQDIVEFSKKRNPFNHPCVMYKKSSVELAGGYQDFFLLEDYYLWIRMLQNGNNGYNFKEPLLWMRSGSNLYRRRSGLKYTKSQIDLFKYMKTTGYISNLQYWCQTIVRGMVSLAPNKLRAIFYKSVLRAM